MNEQMEKERFTMMRKVFFKVLLFTGLIGGFIYALVKTILTFL